MRPIPRLLANLLVTLVNILANLLVKLTKLGLGGGHGGATPRQGGCPRAWEALAGRSTCCLPEEHEAVCVVKLEQQHQGLL